jgi:hypothetical protein
MDTYTLEAGRAIRRNGWRFVYIGSSLNRGEPKWWAPSDFDTFARYVVASIPALRALRAAASGTATNAWEAMNAADAALALLPKQES